MSDASKAIRGALAFTLVAIGLLGAPAAHAQMVGRLDFPFATVTTACNENVELTGVVHTVATETNDLTGEPHFTLHITVEARGVGLTTGTSFVTVQVNTLEENIGASALPLNTTASTVFRLTREGGFTSTDGVLLNGLLHINIDAQGVTTAEVVGFEGNCT